MMTSPSVTRDVQKDPGICDRYQRDDLHRLLSPPQDLLTRGHATSRHGSGG